MAEGVQTEDIDTEQRLPEIYKEIMKSYDVLEATEESLNSDKNQGHVRHGCELCKTAIEMVNKLSLFSNNEEIEEVATNEIKYMLLPALMGYFLSKNTVRERLRVVTESQEFYKDFVRLCQGYRVIAMPKPPEPREENDTKEVDRPKKTQPRPGMQDLMSMAATRNSKIQRYKEQKELEKKLRDLRDVVEQDTVDDEVKRDYFLTLLKRWINICTDELDSIQSEIQILEMMAQRKEATDKGKPEKVKKDNKTPPLRPFIITKDILQKQVYGLGYPSIPTMTIEEFFEKKVEEGTLNEHGPAGHSMQDWAMDPEKDKIAKEKEEEENEAKIEKDDPETLRRAREWDEYRDDHRRGWGNRQNMG